MPLRPLRILHLSDLHLQGSASGPERTSLLTLVNSLDRAPDVIAITGDFCNSPSKDAFERARGFLLELYNEALAAKSPPRDQANTPEARASRHPPIIVCPGNHDVRYCGNLLKNRRPFEAVFHDLTKPLTLPQAFLFSIDSTLAGSLARGGIPTKHLAHLFRNIETLARNHTIRIALIHHHLLPVPAVERQTAGIAAEAAMVMRNPGHTLNALFNLGFCCVLHGHQHAPSSWVLSTRSARSSASMAILGCGSSTSGDPCTASVVDIEPTRGLLITRYRRFSSEPCFTLIPEERQLPLLDARTLSALRQRSDEVRSSIHIKRLTRNVIFSAEGDADFEDVLSSIRFSKANTKHFDLEATSEMGNHCTPEVEFLNNQNMGTYKHCDILRTAQGIRSTGRIEFSPQPQVASSLSLRIQRRIYNAFVLSRQEAKCHQKARARGREDLDFGAIGCTINYPTENMTLIVQFPSKAYCKGGFQVEVIDAAGTVVHELGAPLSELAVGIAQTSSCIVSIDNPLLSHTYNLIWRLPERSSLMLPQVDRATKAFRDALFRHAVNLQESLRRASEATQAVFGETFQLSVMAYDSEKGILRQVANNDSARPDGFELHIGEGFAGRAFKTELSFFWGDQGEEIRRYKDREDCYKEVQVSQYRHSSIASIPVRYRSATRGVPVAIVDFVTRKPDSLLWKLSNCSLARKEEQRLARKLYEFAWGLVCRDFFDVIFTRQSPRIERPTGFEENTDDQLIDLSPE
jgi:predicted phosphodiesterase